MNVIFCNLCDQINGKCVDKIVSAADFAMYNSNSKCPQISSYEAPRKFFHEKLHWVESAKVLPVYGSLALPGPLHTGADHRVEIISTIWRL